MSLNVYTTCSPITVGCMLYSDAGLTTPVSDGKYSDGTNCFTVVSGQVTISSSCGGPEPTPTPTPTLTPTVTPTVTPTATSTSTPTPSPTPGFSDVYDVSTTDGAICSSPVGVLLYSFSAFGVGVDMYTNNSLPLTPLTGYSYIKDPATGTIYNLSSTTGVVGSSTGTAC